MGRTDMASLNIEELKETLTPILKAHDVVRASLFGSVVRGEAGEDSDIDILIDCGETTKSLFELADLQFDLEGKTGRSIDLVFFRVPEAPHA
jgi:predicted nucleotidyltransferase